MLVFALGAIMMLSRLQKESGATAATPTAADGGPDSFPHG